MKTLTLFAILFSLSACQSTPKPQIDFNTETNFTQYKSFSFTKKVPSGQQSNPVLNLKIENAIKEQLISNGFRFSNDQADLKVSYSVTFSEKASSSSFSIGLGGGSYGGGSSKGLSVATTIPIENSDYYTHITIDIRDVDNPVWYGNHKFDSEENLQPDAEKMLIEQTVNALLINFPPQK